MICNKELFTALNDHQVSVTSERDPEALLIPLSQSEILRYFSHSNSQALWDLLSPATQLRLRTPDSCKEKLHFPELSEQNTMAYVGFRFMLLVYPWQQKGINVGSTCHTHDVAQIAAKNTLLKANKNNKQTDDNQVNKTTTKTRVVLSADIFPAD